ncbi:unnamed protein product [Prorocentrum cordatum]|uniref:Radical SAM core domain-containing protein n=1 Tax=Prorocentrum cordatum TaxID=2364126 RepID=A0ABN9U5V2_9DINO|nr:unnamed protein product [Polarella glacialis]
MVLRLQERRMLTCKLADFQRRVLHVGWRGVRAEVQAASADESSAGVATMELKALPAVARQGCAGHSRPRGSASRKARGVKTKEDLADAWLGALNTLEVELAGRHETAGKNAFPNPSKKGYSQCIAEQECSEAKSHARDETEHAGMDALFFEPLSDLCEEVKPAEDAFGIGAPARCADCPRRLTRESEDGAEARCPLDCAFCDSGRAGAGGAVAAAGGNLPGWAIVEQVHAARRLSPAVERVVFMGMGEPLLNYAEVSSAISELRRDPCLGRPWAVTVSTVGVLPRIARLAADHPAVALTLSLHAPSQALRSRLVPAGAARWPLEDVMRAVWAHEEAVGRAPMFAYTVLPGVNDAAEHAEELAQLLAAGRAPGGPRPLVNLIPYNPTGAGQGFGFQTPSDGELRNFRSALRARGIQATVRWTTEAGRPLAAACGQLAARPGAGELETMRPMRPSAAADGVRAAAEGGGAGLAAASAEKSPSAPALTRLLFLAGSTDALLALAQRWRPELNDVHVSAALVTLARAAPGAGASLRADPRFGALIERSAELAPAMGPRAAASVLWALARLRHSPGRDHLDEVAGALERQVAELWPPNLANSLWACGALLYRGEGPLLALEAEAARRALELTPLELANSLWALGRLRRRRSGAPAALAAALGRSAARCKPQDVVNSLWAFQRLRHSPGNEVLTSLASAALTALPRLKPSELAVVVRAFSRLGHDPGEVVQPALVAFAHRVRRRCSAVVPQAPTLESTLAGTVREYLEAQAATRRRPPYIVSDVARNAYFTNLDRDIAKEAKDKMAANFGEVARFARGEGGGESKPGKRDNAGHEGGNEPSSGAKPPSSSSKPSLSPAAPPRSHSPWPRKLRRRSTQRPLAESGGRLLPARQVSESKCAEETSDAVSVGERVQRDMLDRSAAALCDVAPAGTGDGPLRAGDVAGVFKRRGKAQEGR